MSQRLISSTLGTLIILAGLSAQIGCSSQENHITLVDVPSGQVAGIATERGILVLKKPAIKKGDTYSISHVYGNGIVPDEARVVDIDENLALLKPVSSNLNAVRFLLYPLDPEEELYVGVLDEDNDPYYLPSELFEGGVHGDLILCDELEDYPRPTSDGFGGIGVFAYRDGYHWLTGLLLPMKAQISGSMKEAYPFVGMESIVNFFPDLRDNFTRQKRPFRPDLELGLERDGSGE